MAEIDATTERGEVTPLIVASLRRGARTTNNATLRDLTRSRRERRIMLSRWRRTSAK
jgi:hypothetical protein